MKFYEPRHIALLSSVIVTVIFILIFFLTGFILFPHNIWHFSTWFLLAAGAVLFFLISFIIYRYTIDRFIYSKIRLIYKLIHDVKVARGKKPKIHHEPNMLEKVRKEVEDWEEEKQKEIARLKQLELYRRDFIGNVSHELKTPLFNIQGYVSTLIDGGLHDPAINLEYLKRTEKSIERLIRILEDLDEIAQLESGHMRLQVVRFDLTSLTQEVIELLDMKAIKKNVQVTVTNPLQPVWVVADREKIRQVLTNILDNSIRYGNHENGRTKITFFDMDENILTEITDNGIGIDPEDLPRVFERFYRTERGRSATRKGKGLGLAIVKHIIEAHEQTVHVRSTIGVGSTFGFTLKKA